MLSLFCSLSLFSQILCRIAFPIIWPSENSIKCSYLCLPWVFHLFIPLKFQSSTSVHLYIICQEQKFIWQKSYILSANDFNFISLVLHVFVITPLFCHNTTMIFENKENTHLVHGFWDTTFTETPHLLTMSKLHPKTISIIDWFTSVLLIK